MKDITKPSMMTFNEYLEIINPHNEWHESSIRSTELDRFTQYSHVKDFPTLVNCFTSDGLKFELREKIVDAHDDDYVKKDLSGEILFDEKGRARLLNKKDLEERFPPHKRYSTETAIIDRRENKVVASTADEFGCLLVKVATEYQQLGLGEKLLTAHRTKNPYRHSGGFSESGFSTFHKVYQNMVRQSLIAGEYSNAVRSGSKTMDDVRVILDSARISTRTMTPDAVALMPRFGRISYRDRKSKQRQHALDLSMSDPKDWLLHTNGNVAYLYNKKLFDLYDTKRNIDDRFYENGLIGYAYVGGVYGENSVPKLFRLHGQNETIKAFMVEVAVNLFSNTPIRIFDEDWDAVSPKLQEKLVMGAHDSAMRQVVLPEKTMDNIDILNFVERKFRRAVDPYEEKWTRVQESAYALTEETLDKVLDAKKLGTGMRR
jgi:hypothetical protein